MGKREIGMLWLYAMFVLLFVVILHHALTEGRRGRRWSGLR